MEGQAIEWPAFAPFGDNPFDQAPTGPLTGSPAEESWGQSSAFQAPMSALEVSPLTLSPEATAATPLSTPGSITGLESVDPLQQAPLRDEALGDVLIAPAQSSSQAFIAQWTYREASYDNEVGIYEVDAQGGVNGVMPNDPRYAREVLASPSRQILFNSGHRAGNWKKVFTTPGSRLAFYLVPDGSSQAWLASVGQPDGTRPSIYFSVNNGNTDGFDHARSREIGDGIWRFNWEDMRGGGDQDFNDVVFNFGLEGDLVPGTAGMSTPLNVSRLPESVEPASELGYFLVDSSDGSIDGLSPGSEGYLSKALAAGRRTMLLGADISQTSRSVIVPSGALIGWYLVKGQSLAQALATSDPTQRIFLSYAAANADGLNHVHADPVSKTMAWEGSFGGGDREFNELRFRFDYGVPFLDKPNMPVVSVEPSSQSVNEKGNAQALFVLRLSKQSSNTVSVDYVTEAGSATAGLDYVHTTGSVVFQPGQLEATIAVPLLDDPDLEGTETFGLVLIAALNAQIGNGKGYAEVLDDDTGTHQDTTAPVADNESATLAEGGTTANLALLAGDTDSPDDPTGASLKVAQVNGLALSSLTPQAAGTYAGFYAISGSNGTLQVKADGTAFYVHNGSDTTSDSFTYRAVDGAGNLSNLASIGLTITPVDDTAPTVAAALLTDTGRSNQDGITQDPTVQGTSQGAASLWGSFDGASYTEITEVLQPDGSFTIGLQAYEKLSQGSFPDGFHELLLKARSASAVESVVAKVVFTLDRTAPAVNFDLAPESDTGVQSDQTTTERIVTLKGQSEVDAEVRLQNTSSQQFTDPQGKFAFSGVAMPSAGAGAFTMIATDVAGNQGRSIENLIREGINGAPKITSLPKLSFDPEKNPIYTYQVIAEDPDNDILHYRLTSGPKGADINAQGKLTFAPEGIPKSSYAFSVEVDDGRGGVNQQSFTVRVPSVADYGTISGAAWKDSNSDGIWNGVDAPTLGKSRYYLTTATSWTNAEAQAIALGGHLVTINDAKENEFLLKAFGGGSEAFWIGLKEGTQEGSFDWISGEVATYRNWARTEPNNFAGIEDSGLFFGFNQGGPYQAGTWVDIPDAGLSGSVYRGIIEVDAQTYARPQKEGNAEIRLSTITTGFNSPVGIDFHEPSNTLIISANYSSGQPDTFERILQDGSHVAFSSVSGFGDEVKIATVKSDCLGNQFTPGDLFVGNGVDGQIVRITDNGQTVLNPWVDLPGANGLMRGSLYVDRTGVFNGDLIVVTTGGQVWRVNESKVSTLLAEVGTHLEGVSTIPNEPAKYGPLAGKIIAGAEQQGRLYIIDQFGKVDFIEPGVNVEDIDLIEANQNFFGINFGSGRILGAPAADFKPFVGDILLTQEVHSGSGLFRLFWDGSAIRTEQFRLTANSEIPSQWEHVTFAPAGISEIPAVEEGLGGVTVYLDLNRNGQLDSGEPSQMSAGDTQDACFADSSGIYKFSGLLPGEYVVREILPKGFDQTYPVSQTVLGNDIAINGSFEQGPAVGFDVYGKGSTLIAGWEVTQGTIDYGSFWQSSDGLKSLDMDGTPGFGGVKQTLQTIPGRSYRVMFDLAGNPYSTPTIKALGVEANGQSKIFTFNTTGKTWEAMDWRRDEIFDFIAGEATTTLTFTSLNQEGGIAGAALDHVRVYPLSTLKNEHIITVQNGEEVSNVNFGLTRNTDYTGEHDLQIGDINTDLLTIDPQLLIADGPISATIKNTSTDTVTKPFEVAFFEDRNFNKAYDKDLDTVLTTVEVTQSLAGGQSITVSADLSTAMGYAHAPIWGIVDVENVVVETDESNNVSFSESDCLVDPVVGQFNPVVEWAKTEFSVAPESKHVITTPIVADINNDKIPDIIVSTADGIYDGRTLINSRLRAINGATGTELWTVVNADYEVNALAGIAIADIDLDGLIEIMVGDESSQRLIAFENDGTPKWESDEIAGSVTWGAPAIADLNGDGSAEIVIGSTVLNASGQILWAGSSSNAYAGPLSIVGDVNLDGKPEVISGNTIYNSDGSLLWSASVPSGYTALGNFDADSFPEIVVVGEGVVYLLEHSGETKWSVAIPRGGYGGAPTIADFDGDGRPEIGVAGAEAYCAIETDGTIKWTAITEDFSSNVTGSSVFDFDGDGQAEVVYRDEKFLRVYKGSNGQVLYQLEMSSVTGYDYPVIADVDNDGNVEIIVVADALRPGSTGQNGIYVIGDLNDTWVSARKIWNQHSYHITNVNDDGTIPRQEANSWQVYNSYRQNIATDTPALAAPDLITSYLRSSDSNGSSTIQARIGNSGSIFVAAGVSVAFYDGDPRTGGQLLGTTLTGKRLEIGDFEDVSLTVASRPLQTVWVVADDDGTGVGKVRECDEVNNFYSLLGPGKAEIRGTVWSDRDGDGTFDRSGDGSESGLPGVTVYLDVNNNRRLDAGEPSRVTAQDNQRTADTNEAGQYRFTNLSYGSYNVRELVPSGYQQTVPGGDGGASIVLTAASPLQEVNLGNGSIPVITSTPVHSVFAGTTYSYAVQTSDPGGGGLSYRLMEGPSGMAISSAGVVSWNPGALGAFAVALEVSNSAGAKATQSYQVTVEADLEAPMISLRPSGTVLNPGDTLTVNLSATDNVAVQDLRLTLNGVAISLIPNLPNQPNQASVVLGQRGSYTLEATATDVFGNVGRATLNVRVPDPSDTVAPDIDFVVTPFDASKPITSVASVVGSITGDPDSWRVELAPVNLVDQGNPASADPDYVTIASGNSNISAATLATIDPSLFRNDNYLLRVIAQDFSGNVNVKTQVVGLFSEEKPADFKLDFTDLTIPLTGLPIQVGRSYSSLNAQVSGDFGYGWSLSFQDAQIQESAPDGRNLQDDDIFFGNSLTVGTRVTLTNPEGRRVGFTFDPQFVGSVFLLGNLYRPYFRPDPGVFDTLDVSLEPGGLESLVSVRGDGSTASPGFIPFTYNPSTYFLRTKAGDTYQYDQNAGLVDITDRNGNKLTYSNSGISSSTGQSIRFSRDSEGRITEIRDPEGKLIKYSYNALGELVGVTDRTGNTTTMEYKSIRPHYLSRVVDPLGRSASRTEYDDQGRIKRILDADGNALDLSYDPNARVQVVKDPLGNSTTRVFDERGNVIKEVDALGGITERTYFESNLLKSVTDPEGNTTSYTYDNRGNKLTETNGEGETKTYTYTATNKLKTETDALGFTTSYTYDSSDNLKTRTDPLGFVTTYDYETNGLLKSVVDANGKTTTFTYDAQGRVKELVDPTGAKSTFTYDGNGQVKTVTDAKGAVTLYTYDAQGRLIEKADPEGSSCGCARGITKTEYNKAGEKVAETDALGRRTEYRYNSRGLLVETILPDDTPATLANNPRLRSEYDALDRLITSTDELGRATRFTYDKLGRKEFVIHPDETPENLTDNPRSQMVYDRAGRMVAEIDERGNRISMGYDKAGRLISETDGEGHTTTHSYDDDGRKISTTDPLGHTTTYAYDPLDRLIKTTYADGTFTTLSYDGLGRKVEEKDQAGRITKYEYDALGRLTAVVDALQHRTEYTYDKVGNLETQKDANGHITSFTYDSLRRRVTSTMPGGQVKTTIHDKIGNLIRSVDANGVTTTYKYDARNRLIEKAFSDGTPTETFTYTATGQLETVQDNRGTTNYLYNAHDWLLSRTEPDGRQISYTYDSAGNVTSVIVPSGTTTYTHDRNNRIDTVTDPDGGLTDYDYDAAGNLSRTSFANGVVETREYDKLNRLLFLENRGIAGVLSSYRYTLDAVGNRKEVLEADGRKVVYSYDDLYRLTQEQILEPGQAGRTITFEYDKVGNRLKRIDSLEGTTTYSYDVNDRLLAEVLNGQTISYSYDNNGSLTAKATNGQTEAEYRWNAKGELAAATISSGGNSVTVSYEYDQDGIRVAATVNGQETRFLIDKTQQHYAQVIEEYLANGGLLKSYSHGWDLLSQDDGNARTYYQVDGLGSTRLLTDSSGNVQLAHDYQAFGELLNQSGSGTNSYLFAGEQFDQSLDLTYLRARYYDMGTGRFVSVDPFEGLMSIPSSLQNYPYASNTPVNSIDPSGMMAITEWALLTSVVVGQAIAVLAPITVQCALKGQLGDGTTMVLMLGASFTGPLAAIPISAAASLMELFIAAPKEAYLTAIGFVTACIIK